MRLGWKNYKVNESKGKKIMSNSEYKSLNACLVDGSGRWKKYLYDLFVY